MQSWTLDRSPTCYLHFTLWRCLCAWKSSRFQKKVSFTQDDAVEINQANQTSPWPRLCFWKSNMKYLHRCRHLQPDKLPSILQSARCPEANLISPEFWTLLLATSNISNVPIRSAGTHQVIWPWHSVTLRTERHNGRERSLYSFTSYSLKSLDSLNHECHLEQMSLRQIAPAVHPRGRHRVWEILAFESPLLRQNVTIWMRPIMSQP